MRSLFLSHQHALHSGGGGLQRCTREYHALLREAGFTLVDCTYDTDRRLSTRLRRQLRPAPYAHLIPEDYFPTLARAIEEQRPAFVFCNLQNFIPVARRLRAHAGDASRLVLLSHGLASVDDVHGERIARSRPTEGLAGRRTLRSDAWIGREVSIECDNLPVFDHVFCLAPFEVEICRWLGARSVTWLPRSIDPNRRLEWMPLGDRVGCVGTFDHPPNLEGIEELCLALHAAGPSALRLRLITRSRTFAAALARRYPFVDDLGPLEAPGELEGEAATWSAFVHPIFCYAMGCSTKVATALMWGVPILTTRQGLRGYTWAAGNLPVSETAAELAARTLEALRPAHAAALREEVLRVVRSSPDLSAVARQVRCDLGIS